MLLGCMLAACPKKQPIPSADPLAVPSELALTLPTSSATDAPGGGVKIYLARDGLFFSDPSTRIADPPIGQEGFAPKYKLGELKDALEIVPLRDRLKDDIEAIVYADASTDFRALSELAFTLRRAKGGRFSLAVAGLAGISSLSIQAMPPPTCSMHLPLGDAEVAEAGALPPCGAEATPKLRLMLHVVREGIAVKAVGASVGPGCKEVGSGLAIRGHASAPLRTCVDRVRGMAKGAVDGNRVTVSANRDFSLQQLVQIIDAVRVDDDGRAMFTSIALGVPL